MSTLVFLSEPTRYLTGSNTQVLRGNGWGLLLHRVVLDDELLLDREIDLGPHRSRVHEHPHPRRDGLEPRRDDALARGLARHDERGHLQALLAHVDDVVGV